MRRNRTLSILIAAALASTPLLAAQKQQTNLSQEAFYRCKDAKGQTHYGDSLPEACMGLDTEVLNERGMMLRMIEGEQTRAARIAREQSEAKARREREERQQRDNMLIDTYLTVADIERLRDQRLDLLASQYRITEQNIRNLRDRQSRLEGQIARFKPYNDNPNAPPLPDHLAEEMVNTVNSLRVYEEDLNKNRAEQARIKRTFDSDIQRFKELKGIR